MKRRKWQIRKAIATNGHSATIVLFTAFYSMALAVNGQAPLETNVVPVEMQNMPISQAIEVTAHAAGINYLVDPRLAAWWNSPTLDGCTTHEPTLTFRGNMTPREALLRVLKEHHLVLLEDPPTTIARITYTNQIVPPADAVWLDGNTNGAVPVQFQDVPITVALERLARLAGINYLLDPQIGFRMPDKYGKIKAEPLLNVRWWNVTARQGLVALCENYRLAMVKDPTSGALLLRAEGHPVTQFIDTNFLGSDAITPVPIDMQGVTVDYALKQLANHAHIEVNLDSQIGKIPMDYGSLGQMKVSFHFENLSMKQAIILLCENYDLVISKDPSTGFFQIKSAH